MATTARGARVARVARVALNFLVDKRLNQSGEVNWGSSRGELILLYSGTRVVDGPDDRADAQLPVKLVIGSYPSDW